MNFALSGAYLLGSVNFSIVISKIKYHDDIRNYGSKNAGFTNMRRVYGTKAGVAAISGDLLKGVISVLLPLLILGEDPAYIAGLFCILGHCYPIYYGFKGGKGVATAASMILVLEPLVFLMVIAIFVVVTLTTKYLSLGSICAALFYPLILNRFYNLVYGRVFLQFGNTGSDDGYIVKASFIITIISVFLSAFIIFKHRSNIKRLWNGNENKFIIGQKSLKSTEQDSSEKK